MWIPSIKEKLEKENKILRDKNKRLKDAMKKRRELMESIDRCYDSIMESDGKHEKD